MELTGKTKTDFDTFIKNEMYYLGKEQLSDNFMHTLYIEFFDSKEININIQVIYDRSSKYVRGFDSEIIFIQHGDLKIINSDCLKNDIYETRQEAISLAIRKADELYNHLHN